MLWSSLGTEETHTEAGGRETRIGRLDPPIVWNDDGGEFAVERYCVCIKTPIKGVVRLLCNGAPDGNFYGRVFARLRMAAKYDWQQEQNDEKLSGELYEMLRADSAEVIARNVEFGEAIPPTPSTSAPEGAANSNRPRAPHRGEKGLK